MFFYLVVSLVAATDVFTERILSVMVFALIEFRNEPREAKSIAVFLFYTPFLLPMCTEKSILPPSFVIA